MTTPQSDTRGGYTRRAVLGAVGLGLSSGCVQRTRGLANRRSPEQVALTIKTVPADTDRTATRIARLLTANLEAVGIDAEIALLSEDELYRDVLINHEFDIYVARTETQDDPDALRELLHSSFNEEAGWQNPFGYSDLTMDELLEEQRKRTRGRRETVFDIQRRIAQEHPFTVIGHVESINAIRRDRFRGWEAFDPTTPTSCLQLEPRSDEIDTLSVTSTDERVTRNFNPIAVEFRSNQQITELLYDPLAHRNGGESLPWLAESWSWDTGVNTTATVNLRSASHWHDGTDLTADDVVFTYRFLQDTTMDDGERTVPAPRFRGQTSLVEAVERIDHSTVKFEFGHTSPEVAERAFTVPVLPAHVWEERTAITDLPGFEIFDGATEALVWENPEPVGSGPMQFVSSQTDEEVILRTFDDHVLSTTPEEIGGGFGGGIRFDELHVLRSPTDETAIEFVA